MDSIAEVTGEKSLKDLYAECLTIEQNLMKLKDQIPFLQLWHNAVNKMNETRIHVGLLFDAMMRRRSGFRRFDREDGELPPDEDEVDEADDGGRPIPPGLLKPLNIYNY